MRIVMTLLPFLLLLNSLFADRQAEDGPKTSSKVTYVCRHRGDEKIKIDGHLDEAAWKQAEPLKNFTLIKSDGKKAGKTTVANLLWDDKNLFVAFDCANDVIKSEAKERDDPVWEAEAAEIFLCPKGADAVYYEFNFSPKNVIYDSRLESWKYEDQAKNWKKWSKNFNADIKSEVIYHKEDGKLIGWTVEAAVPFKDFDVIDGKAPKPGDLWLFNVFRIAMDKNNAAAYSHWQPVTPEFHRPQQFPRMKFEGKID